MAHKPGKGMTGKKHSSKTKLKISLSNKGKKRSKKIKQIISKKTTQNNFKTWKNKITKKKRSDGISKARLKGRTRKDLYKQIKKLAFQKFCKHDLV